MIIVTGAAGFIGSCMISHLLLSGYDDIVGVDDFSSSLKINNHKDNALKHRVDRKKLFDFIEQFGEEISYIIHLGARTDTVDQDPEIFRILNLDYSKRLWDLCCKFQIQLIYASSAATYGDGKFGFDDQMTDFSNLVPLNEYGRSKQNFDLWALSEQEKPPYWIGLKFFNVYGPNEYHKARMASVIFHAYHQIQKTGQMKLFRSHKAAYGDGEQLRDFIYVKDVCNTIVDLMQKHIRSGIYNLGTGKARTFLDLVNGVFHSLKIPAQIEFIDIPEDIRENYQYFTEAKMQKLAAQEVNVSFASLESGIEDYVKNYLLQDRYF